MKSKIYSFRLLISFLVVVGAVQMSSAQSEYFREGFDGTSSFETGGISTVNPLSSGGPNNYYAKAATSQYWFMHNAYRTTGTPCPSYGSSHIRLLQNGADTPYLITPVLGFGVGTVHLSRSANSATAGARTRKITIFFSTDTAATVPYNGGTWEVGYRMGASDNFCVDSGIVINRPDAKRVAFIVSQATNADIDSIWITSTSPITPVKFAGVSAANVNGVTKVSWKISTEINTHSYFVEKSINGASFNNSGEVIATNAGSYSWIDNAAGAGVTYYRIKAVDKDGKLTYSSVVKISGKKGRPEFVIAPNVVRGRTLNLQINNVEKGNVELQVSNNGGQVVYRTSFMNEGGSSSKSIQLPYSLTTGTYRVQMVTSGTVLTQTAILQ